MSQFSAPKDVEIFFNSHEDNSKVRIIAFQNELNQIGNDHDALEALRIRIEIQLKIEDFMIRFREADHAKMSLWSSRFVPLLAGVAGSALTLVWQHFVR